MYVPIGKLDWGDPGTVEDGCSLKPKCTLLGKDLAIAPLWSSWVNSQWDLMAENNFAPVREIPDGMPPTNSHGSLQ
ncbi:hypothetical protein TNCV_2765261 [Trichonephila clavipes]|nr:hypothetical protein TNCV_2765261 [Trichonephila clavipes]